MSDETTPTPDPTPTPEPTPEPVVPKATFYQIIGDRRDGYALFTRFDDGSETTSAKIKAIVTEDDATIELPTI